MLWVIIKKNRLLHYILDNIGIFFIIINFIITNFLKNCQLSNFYVYIRLNLEVLLYSDFSHFSIQIKLCSVDTQIGLR